MSWQQRMADDRTDLVKIAFTIENPENAGCEIEWLWVIPAEDDTYIVDNSPFSIYGISLKDKVLAHEENGILKFVRVVARSGHSTYRVRLPVGRDHQYFLKYWPNLEKLGCTYEGSDGRHRLYAIDIPDIQSVPDAYDILQKYENAGLWEFEEAHFFCPLEESVPSTYH